MYKTILVPVDLAEPAASEGALATAARLADAGDGTIRLIYVRPLMPVTYMEYVPASFEQDQQREAEEKLGDIAASVPLPKERVSAVVRLGSIYHEVLAEAEDAGADLVVVGSHRPTMATYLLGSNATTIVRHATSSVLVVR
ncbi:universal stress protein [Salinarimonas rosea]|uniref:universal stress protein n=1 Tax=Salinarimonas rosea TaxID=552063 RepID=UPI00040619A5|nr:universal stress protein [Salinarimonas rosea]